MKTIWKNPCKKCPSAHYPPDPEALDMDQFYKNGEITLRQLIFPCAWRPQKFCKGICDRNGVTEEQIKKEIIDGDI